MSEHAASSACSSCSPIRRSRFVSSFTLIVTPNRRRSGSPPPTFVRLLESLPDRRPRVTAYESGRLRSNALEGVSSTETGFDFGK